MALTASPDTLISHWSTLIENLQASPLQFYQSVEEALQRRQVPQTRNERVDYKEAGLLSANREYLHVRREKLVFDICGAPFGNGFFVSWWLAEPRLKLNPLLQVLFVFIMLAAILLTLNTLGLFWGSIAVIGVIGAGLAVIDFQTIESGLDDSLIRALPILGWLYERLFKPATYYRIDSMLMFQKSVHNAVLEVIDAMTTAKGLRALDDTDRKPVIREFYKRAA